MSAIITPIVTDCYREGLGLAKIAGEKIYRKFIGKEIKKELARKLTRIRVEENDLSGLGTEAHGVADDVLH